MASRLAQSGHLWESTVFIDQNVDLSSAYNGQLSQQLVVLALICASMATFIAFNISEHLYSIKTRSKWLWFSWMLCGSLVLGGGLWSSHFVSVLAFALPVPFALDVTTSMLSFIPAVVAAAVVLRIERGVELDQLGKWMAAIVLGTGIGVMHYFGMEAMRINAHIMFDPIRVAYSMTGVILLSFLALNVMWKIRQIMKQRELNSLIMTGSALFMGLSITAINLIMMYSAHFIPAPEKQQVMNWPSLTPDALGWLVAAVGILVFLVTFAAVHLSSRLGLASLVESSSDYARELLNSSNDGIITTDNRGLIKSCNTAAEQLFGYTEEQMLEKNCLRLLPSAARDEQANVLATAGPTLKTIINHTIEMEFCKADDAKFPAELTIYPINHHGRLDFVGVVHDLRPQLKVEADNRILREKLEFLVTASPVATYICKASGSFPLTYISPNIERLSGYSPEEISASTNFWSSRIHPDDFVHSVEDRKKTAEQGLDQVVYRLLQPDGNYRWFSDTRSPVLDMHGITESFVGCLMDIHDKKVAELKVEHDEHRLKLSIKLAKMATWDWVIQTGEVIWSNNMQEKLGLPGDQAASFGNFVKAVHPEDQRFVKDAFKKSLVLGEDLDIEYRIVKPDKSIHWHRSVGGLINDDLGHPVHMVGVLYEINDRKRLRLAPVGNPKMESDVISNVT